MRMMARFLHCVLAATLFHETSNLSPPMQSLTPTERKLFLDVYESASCLLDFILMAQYPSHDSGYDEDDDNYGSLDCMEYYLQKFNEMKHIFVPWRASTTVKRKPKT